MTLGLCTFIHRVSTDREKLAFTPPVPWARADSIKCLRAEHTSSVRFSVNDRLVIGWAAVTNYPSLSVSNNTLTPQLWRLKVQDPDTGRVCAGGLFLHHGRCVLEAGVARELCSLDGEH